MLGRKAVIRHVDGRLGGGRDGRPQMTIGARRIDGIATAVQVEDRRARVHIGRRQAFGPNPAHVDRFNAYIGRCPRFDDRVFDVPTDFLDGIRVEQIVGLYFVA